MDELIRGNIKVEWSELGEGLCGEYNSKDSKDIELLRFDVYKLENKEWIPIDDASYCTLVPVSTDRITKMKLLKLLMDEIYEPASSGYSIKKLCERLSWVDKSWLKKRG